MTVGKLNADKLFENALTAPPPSNSSPDRPRVVGKITPRFVPAAEQATDKESDPQPNKFYKPTVQPKKMKIDQIFSQPLDDDFGPAGQKVGKLDTAKIFQQVHVEIRSVLRGAA